MDSIPPRIDSDNPSALPMGTRLGEFELLSLLGVGGFGIVYLAFDHALEREVAVKEYMPASLAGRTETMHVSLRSQNDADTFALGLKSFVNEAKLLARFDHPSLLKVHRFWEANGTAYMAMPVMRGRTLKDVRAEMGMPDEAWLRAMLTPLLGAIEKLHAEGVYHRDIAPDNIQIGPDGHPVLLDFGAARRVISDKSQTLTAILKPAYAPIEQYAEAGSVKQGPWTDLYALGATLHYLLLNRPPAPATTRAIHDEASGLSTELCPGCSEDFLRTIDWMLAPRPADRPQSVAALREVLDGHLPPPRRRSDDAAAQASQWDRTVIVGGKPGAPATTLPPGSVDVDVEDDPDATRVVPQERSASRVVPAPRVTPAASPVPVSRPAASPAAPLASSPTPPPAAAAGAAVPASPGAGRRWLPAALGLGAVAVAGAAFVLWPRGPAVPAPELAASAPAAVAAASVPAAAPEALPAVAAAAPAASAAVPESAITTVVVPAAPAARPAATTAEASPPRPARTERPAPPPRTAVAPAPASVPAATTVTAAEPPRAQTAPTEAPPPSVAPPPEPAKPVVASGPEAICEGRNPVMYFVCMERECLRSKFQLHNDCQKWRKEARREVN